MCFVHAIECIHHAGLKGEEKLTETNALFDPYQKSK